MNLYRSVLKCCGFRKLFDSKKRNSFTSVYTQQLSSTSYYGYTNRVWRQSCKKCVSIAKQSKTGRSRYSTCIEYRQNASRKYGSLTGRHILSFPWSVAHTVRNEALVRCYSYILPGHMMQVRCYSRVVSGHMSQVRCYGRVVSGHMTPLRCYCRVVSGHMSQAPCYGRVVSGHMTPLRCYCRVASGDEDGVNDEDNTLDEDYEDLETSGVDALNAEFNASVKQFCHLQETGHKVFVLQIYSLYRSLKSMEPPRNAETIELDLDENIALIEAIPKWDVVDAMIVKVKNSLNSRQMTSAFEKASEVINSLPDVTAVFVTMNDLSSPLLVTAQQKWKVPVYDRSFIITQVFKSYAVTREAKIHVALAELPYLKFCLMHRASFKFNEDMPRYGATLPIKDQEKKLKTSLVTLKKQRSMVRSRRNYRQIPTVAVIGYTNSGKTTLIKALTGDKALIPRNRLFATLDVTAHSGLLPNHMMVVYMDTVGFISDLPSNMKSAFTATLEDTISADVIIHVRDISHPDTEEQKFQVIDSVSKLIPADKLNTIIEVCNKVDCLDSSDSIDDLVGDYVFPISAVTGQGMDVLLPEIQDKLLKAIDVRQKRLKIPLNGPHFSWLHKEATVVCTDVTDDPESVIVDVYITETNYRKFLAKFRTKKSAYGR